MMTKDEKIAYYLKIEQALNIEYPVMHEGMTETQIRSLIAEGADTPVTVDDLEPLSVGLVKEITLSGNTPDILSFDYSKNIIILGIETDTHKYYNEELQVVTGPTLDPSPNQDADHICYPLAMYISKDSQYMWLQEYVNYDTNSTRYDLYLLTNVNGEYKNRVRIDPATYDNVLYPDIKGISLDGRYMVAVNGNGSGVLPIYVYTIDVNGGVVKTAVEFKADNASTVMWLDTMEDSKTKAFYLVDNDSKNIYTCHFEDSNTYQTVAEGQSYSFTDLNITDDNIFDIRAAGDYVWVISGASIYLYEKEYTNNKHKLNYVTEIDGDMGAVIVNGAGDNLYIGTNKLKKYHAGAS